jgi:hypothetical protein
LTNTVTFTITVPSNISWNWKTQYQVTFAQTGVSSDFTGTVVTIDGTNYGVGALSVSFWWDSGSVHAFSFASPLTVNASKSYVWNSTSGLLTIRNGNLNVTGFGSVTGKYVVHIKYPITFDPGVGTDFTGTVVIIDGTNYNVTALPITFWWDNGSVHTFAFQSPLVVTPNAKQYVWNSTSGLSNAQSGSITVLANGTVIGDYKTQYYLTLATSPSGVASPSGSGWYYNDTNATISTPAFVNITIGSSRYRFNGWTTIDMTEISNALASPTEVRMDKAKTVTAKYVIQYWVTFTQSGVGSDFTGNVATIDISAYTVITLPHSFWWDNGSVHNFAFNSPLEVTPNAKRYVWANTTGLSNVEIGTITVKASGIVSGNYKTQYYLTITSAYGSPNPTSGYVNAGPITAGVLSWVPGPTGTRYVCTGWIGTGSAPSSGSSSSVNFIMNAPSSITWNWKTQYLLTVLTTPANLSPEPSMSPTGEADASNSWWYDASTSVTLTAKPVYGCTFEFWDVDGSSQGNGNNPITVSMNGPHTATAHYQMPISPAAPVGGYAFVLTEPAQVGPLAGYAMILAIFGAVIALIKRKRK